jgi:hypothetical protein
VKTDQALIRELEARIAKGAKGKPLQPATGGGSREAGEIEALTRQLSEQKAVNQELEKQLNQGFTLQYPSALPTSGSSELEARLRDERERRQALELELAEMKVARFLHCRAHRVV